MSCGLLPGGSIELDEQLFGVCFGAKTSGFQNLENGGFHKRMAVVIVLLCFTLVYGMVTPHKVIESREHGDFLNLSCVSCGPIQLYAVGTVEQPLLHTAR